MAKKNVVKAEPKEVKAIVDTKIDNQPEIVEFKEDIKIETEIPTMEVLEPLNTLQETITIDEEKFSKELEEMKEEIFKEDKKEVIEKKEKNKENNKPVFRRLMGYVWNGLQYDI